MLQKKADDILNKADDLADTLKRSDDLEDVLKRTKNAEADEIVEANKRNNNEFDESKPSSSNCAIKAKGTYKELVTNGQKDAHHIIQDAAVRDLNGYDSWKAPAVQLDGPSTTINTEHYYATQEQRKGNGGTYGYERGKAYIALIKAGIPKNEAKDLIKYADEYFMGELGLTLSSPTRIPGNRR